MIVPLTVTVPTNKAFSLADKDKLESVWLFLTKKEEDKLEALTVESDGVPISKVSPNTTPKKVSELAGASVNVIVLDDIVKADPGSCWTPEMLIIQFSSDCGETLTPALCKVIAVVEPLKLPDISDNFL